MTPLGGSRGSGAKAAAPRMPKGVFGSAHIFIAHDAEVVSHRALERREGRGSRVASRHDERTARHPDPGSRFALTWQNCSEERRG